jgi:hypothetical protein
MKEGLVSGTLKSKYFYLLSCGLTYLHAKLWLILQVSIRKLLSSTNMRAYIIIIQEFGRRPQAFEELT